eukprot:UN19092
MKLKDIREYLQNETIRGRTKDPAQLRIQTYRGPKRSFDFGKRSPDSKHTRSRTMSVGYNKELTRSRTMSVGYKFDVKTFSPRSKTVA